MISHPPWLATKSPLKKKSIDPGIHRVEYRSPIAIVVVSVHPSASVVGGCSIVGPILNGDLDVIVGEDEGSVAGSEFRRHLVENVVLKREGFDCSNSAKRYNRVN